MFRKPYIRDVYFQETVYQERICSGKYILGMYSETLNIEYIERIHQISYFSLSDI